MKFSQEPSTIFTRSHLSYRDTRLLTAERYTEY